MLLGALVAGCEMSQAPGPVPAGVAAQSGRLEGAPLPPEGAQMRFPYPVQGVTYDIAVAQVRGQNAGVISVGVRYGAFPDAATAGEVAQKACAAIGRTAVKVPGQLSLDGTRHDFAGGCL